LAAYTLDIVGCRLFFHGAAPYSSSCLKPHTGNGRLYDVFPAASDRGDRLHLVLAVTVHGLVDSVLPALQRFDLSAAGIEIIFGIVVLTMVVYAIYSKRYYMQGGQGNGKTENG
jgi:hypothetical protein